MDVLQENCPANMKEVCSPDLLKRTSTTTFQGYNLSQLARLYEVKMAFYHYYFNNACYKFIVHVSNTEMKLSPVSLEVILLLVFAVHEFNSIVCEIC